MNKFLEYIYTSFVNSISNFHKQLILDHLFYFSIVHFFLYMILNHLWRVPGFAMPKGRPSFNRKWFQLLCLPLDNGHSAVNTFSRKCGPNLSSVIIVNLTISGSWQKCTKNPLVQNSFFELFSKLVPRIWWNSVKLILKKTVCQKNLSMGYWTNILVKFLNELLTSSNIYKKEKY